MKKTCKALLALALCLALLPVAALASPGDAVIARRDDESFGDYISGMTAIGDTLYLLGYNTVYTWKSGEADVTRYEADEEAQALSYGSRALDDADQDEAQIYENFKVYCLVAADGALYELAGRSRYNSRDYVSTFEGMFLYRVSLNEGERTYSLEEAGELDWEPMMEYYDEDVYPRSPEGALVIGEAIYARTYSDNGGYDVFAVPMDGGYAKQVEEIESAAEIAAYTDGRLLAELFSYEDPSKVTFVVWDPESETLETMCELPIEDYNRKTGLVADTETGTIYFLEKGSLWAFDPDTLESAPVNDFPTSSVNSDTTALLLDGGYYVNNTWDATIVRNTDPALRAEKTLAVNNTAYLDVINQIYYDYSNLHGDVSLSIANDWSAGQKLVEAMMNRSTQYDVYIMRTVESPYNAVYKRGYMAELGSSEKLSAFVAQMYPSLAAALQANGELVAIPIEVSSQGPSLQKTSLEALGVSEEEIPTNWPDFLDWLAALAPKLEEAGVSLTYDWTTQSEFRKTLFGHIFNDYQKYLNQTGQEQGYNTELLSNALRKLEALDLAAFGLPEEYNWEETRGGSRSDQDLILFSDYNSLFTIDQGYSFQYTVPLLLSMSADTPAYLQLDATVAFVNPYSEHRAEAIEFLETAVAKLSYGMQANLIPTMNEPSRPSYYEENRQAVAEALETIRQQLAEASDEEKQMYEDMLRDHEQYLDYVENGMWEVSPDAIAWYRAHDENVVLAVYSPLYNDEGYSEFYDIIQQYVEGGMPLEQMLRSLDQKVQMMVLEGD